MSCAGFEIAACVPEGDSITIAYNLTDENGDPITSVDKLEYTLSDGTTTLIDWTEISVPDLPAGTIKIPGVKNRVVTLTDRFFTLHAEFNSGIDDNFETMRYQIANSPNVAINSPT